MLSREALLAAGVGPFAASLDVVEETGSTNDDLVAAARRGAPSFSALVAEAQRRGRGRLGRAWSSAPGESLTLSVLLRPHVGLSGFPPLALVAGVAVAEAVEEAARVRAELKWPNDLLVDGKKICGVLAEAVDLSPPALVLGVGLNVNQLAFEGDLAGSATSLRLETGRAHDRLALAAALLKRLAARFADVEAGGIDAVLEAWAARSCTLGRRVETATASGLARAIDRDGALLVEDEEGRSHRIVA